ncbi:DUF4198 domain-containing protein [Arenibacterium halophilum]|nr:DUF4198 domain-containing protein [Arenibacterium halophilum]
MVGITSCARTGNAANIAKIASQPILALMRPCLSLAIVVAAILSCLPALAHEFWISPEDYRVAPGAPLVAHLRNGQSFKGAPLAYFSTKTARFELIQGANTEPVKSRMGDIPALSTTAPPSSGLLVILHVTRPARVTYAEMATFQSFVAHKDLAVSAADHAARGLPESDFTESYRRFAKALVAVGDGAGADQPTGMETEFVALTNPYADHDGTVRLRLLYQGKSRGNAQVELFDKAPDGTVTTTLYRTDAQGIVTLPVTPGHSYLADAVVLRPAPPGGDIVYESLWAAMTFAVP